MPLALLVAARGIVALVTHDFWVAPKYSAPHEVVGAAADVFGFAYIGLASILIAGWVTSLPGQRRLGLLLLIIALCVTLVAFGYALFYTPSR